METVRNNNDREDAGKPIEEKPVSARLEKIADEMAGRGRARQQHDEASKDVIVESDGHGST